MLQQDKPDDYVLATGETHTVREFIEKSFAVVGTTIKWMGDAGTVDEYGVDADDESNVLVRIDPQYFRPTEVELLLGRWNSYWETRRRLRTRLGGNLARRLTSLI